MRERNFGWGYPPDVKWLGDDLYLAYQDSPTSVVVDKLDSSTLGVVVRQVFPLTEGAAAYPRLGRYEGQPAVIYRQGGPDFTARWIALPTGAETVLGPSYGNDPVAMGYGWLAWQYEPDRSVRRRREGELVDEVVGSTAPTGLAHLDSAGRVWLVDEVKDTYLAKGYTRLWQEGLSGSVELPNGGNLGWLPSQDTCRFFGSAESFTPHCTWNGHTFVIATSGRVGVRVAAAEVDDFHAPSEIAPFPRPLFAGYFYQWSDRYGDNPSAPSNWTHVAEAAVLARAKGSLVVMAEHIAQAALVWNRVVAVYAASEAHPDQLENVIQQARREMQHLHLPRRPVLSYTADRLINTSADWVGIQLYFMHPTNVLAYAKPYLAATTKPVVLICQAYDRNGLWTDEAAIADLQAQYVEVARAFPQVVGLLWFSDGRPGGTREYSSWRHWHEATLGVISSAPPIQTLPDPEPPKPIPVPPEPVPPPIPEPPKPVPVPVPSNPAPPPPKDKPVIKTLALKASNGQYVRADEGGGIDTRVENRLALVADRDRPGAHETFTLEGFSDDYLALKTGRGFYLTAELGGGDSIRTNEQAIGPWEMVRFVGELVQGGRVGLQTWNDHWFCAEAGGGGEVHARRTIQDAWETFTIDVIEEEAAPSPDPPIARRGQLRIKDGGFADDTGPCLPVFCHAGDLFSAYTRTPDPVLAQLSVIAQASYRGIRFWTTLGGPYWENIWRPVGPDLTEQYWARLYDFLVELRARGLSVLISQGDVGQIRDRRGFMRQLASIVNDVGPDVAAIVDGGNEAWQTGEPDPAKLSEMVSVFRAVCPGPLLTLTSPQGETKAELDTYSIPPADLFDVHGARGGHWWDKVRHIFSVAYEQKPAKRLGIQSEPTGPGELVSVTDFKNELTDDTLAAMAVMSLLSRQAWVYMSGHGVVWRGPLESQPGFWSVPKAVALLPKDITSWPSLCHGGDVWRYKRVFAAQGELRADHAFSADNRFACLLYGPSPTASIQAERAYQPLVNQQFGPNARLVVGRLI